MEGARGVGGRRCGGERGVSEGGEKKLRFSWSRLCGLPMVRGFSEVSRSGLRPDSPPESTDARPRLGSCTGFFELLSGEELERSMKLYVGNLSFNTTESELESMFAEHGPVQSTALIMDRDTGRPRGFGFVEMDDDAAKAAMAALNGKTVDGRELTVNEARSRGGR